MSIVQKEVVHITFGAGIIVNRSEERIEIRFAEPIGLKSFVYPSAFGQYLRMADPASQNIVDVDYKEQQKIADEIIQQLEAIRRKTNEQLGQAKAARLNLNYESPKNKRLMKSNQEVASSFGCGIIESDSGFRM